MGYKLPAMPPVWSQPRGVVANDDSTVYCETSFTNHMRITVSDTRHGEQSAVVLTYTQAQKMLWILQDALRTMRDAS